MSHYVVVLRHHGNQLVGHARIADAGGEHD